MSSASAAVKVYGPGFPIPMRGNERDQCVAAGVAFHFKFPIPMRGNEMGEASRGDLPAAVGSRSP